MKTVYDPDGKPFQKEYVDAAECVEVLGWTWENPADKDIHAAEVKKKQAEADKLESQHKKIHGK